MGQISLRERRFLADRAQLMSVLTKQDLAEFEARFIRRVAVMLAIQTAVLFGLIKFLL